MHLGLIAAAIISVCVVCVIYLSWAKHKCVIKIHFSFFSTKTCGGGTQKNHLKEMVLLSRQDLCLN